MFLSSDYIKRQLNSLFTSVCSAGDFYHFLRISPLCIRAVRTFPIQLLRIVNREVSAARKHLSLVSKFMFRSKTVFKDDLYSTKCGTRQVVFENGLSSLSSMVCFLCSFEDGCCGWMNGPGYSLQSQGCH